MQEKMVLQIHITNKCNLRCKHCYQEDIDRRNTISTDNIQRVFNEFIGLSKSLNRRPHINITGGEPFLHKDIFTILQTLENLKVTYGILTNGHLLNEDVLKQIKDISSQNLSFMQISLDGTQKIHDNIRGDGSYNKAIKALKQLKKHNIQSMVSFTITKSNYTCIDKLINEITRIDNVIKLRIIR